MVEFLKTNANWIFDGIGVVILVAMFGVLARYSPTCWKLVSYPFRKTLKKNLTAESQAESQTTTPEPASKPANHDSKSSTRKLKTSNAMEQIHILFIDDDVKFRVIGILQKAGWKNTSIVKDITNLDEEIVQQTDIFFIDINGVGTKLGFKDEGLGLTLALKKRYPEKTVIIYSADTVGERFHPAWQEADDRIAKNADPYEFQQMVEEYALARCDA